MKFDFLDFGCSNGGSIQFAYDYLGGKKGLGIDRSPHKVQKSIENGYEAINKDIQDLDFEDNSVRFTSMSHFLEHLPNIDVVKNCVKKSLDLSRDFVYIRGPVFDDDVYLERLGFKYYWSSWTGHTCHLKTSDLLNILNQQGADRVHLFKYKKVTSSDDSSIHPLNSPLDQHDYDSLKHPYKASIRFKEGLYREFIALVKLSDFEDFDLIKNRIRSKGWDEINL